MINAEIKNIISIHTKNKHNVNQPQPNDFVSPGGNHHIAVYEDNNGNYQENVVSYFEAVGRVIEQGNEPIDYQLNKDIGWRFKFTMKKNEYFVFPNPQTGFNPEDIDLTNPDNYNIISPNLYRVQKLSSKNYVFRHHLETSVANNDEKLRDITWKNIRSANGLKGIVKVRINHLGQIVQVGE